MSADGWYNYIDFLGRTVVFPAPTDATNEMLRAIREEVDALYIEGTRYRKTGIVFFGLEKPGTAHQTDLFDDTPPAEKSRLYAAVDALNARYGKGKVFSARHSLTLADDRSVRRLHDVLHILEGISCACGSGTLVCIRGLRRWKRVRRNRCRGAWILACKKLTNERKSSAPIFCLNGRFSIFARAEGVGLPEGAQRLSREAVTRGRATRRKPSAFVRNCAN